MENEQHRKQIAKKLLYAREGAGLTQGQVAKLMSMHRPTISEIEAGRRKVSAEELIKFSEIYDVTVQWLVGEAEDELDDRIMMAARQLSNIKPNDLEKVVRFLKSLNKSD